MPQPAVVFGGPSPEHDVSVLTGLQAVHGLGDARAVYWTRTGQFFDVDPRLEAIDYQHGVPRGSTPLRLVSGEGLVGKRRPLDVSAVVNCCHGAPGEDGTLQGALDLAGLAYTGPSLVGAALAMDKLAFADVVRAAGLPSLPRVALAAGSALPFPGPYIVKPRHGGSSIGIDVVSDEATARARLSANPHLRAGAVVEPYLDGAEDLNVAVRSWPELQLSAIERPLRGDRSGGILGYADKYVGAEGMAGAPRELPARVPAEVAERVREMATAVAILVGVRGVARVDFLCEGDRVYVNEVNTVPGSLAKHLWVEPHLAFADLLAGMLDEAVQRPTHRYITAGADGALLRSANSIASKLA